MKRKLAAILSFYLFLGGWSFPEHSPYLIVNCALGDYVSIYFPHNMVEYLNVGDNYVISSYSGNLYGFYGSETRINFPTYSNPTYNNGYQSYDLQITKVVENHLFDDNKSIIDRNLNYYILAALGGLIVICFFKK